MNGHDLIVPSALPQPDDPEAAWPVAFAVRVGTFVTCAVVAFFVVWGTFVPLDSAVVASGELVGAANRQLIQHLEGGVVREILVREGQQVAQGDLLVRLDDRVIRSDLAAAELGLADAEFRLARLIAEAGGAQKLSLPLPDGLTHADPDEIAAARNAQHDLFYAQLATDQRIAEESAAKLATTTIDAQALRDRAATKRAETGIIQTELARREGLRTRNLGTQDTLFAAELQLANARSTVVELETAAQRADASAVQIKAEGERIRAERQTRVRADTVEIRARQSELDALRGRLLAALLRTEIRAPTAGVVTGLSLHTVGGIVAPGQQIGLVVPQDGALVFVAAVSVQDVDRVGVGQEARIRFAGFDRHRTPEIPGAVRTVAADRTTTPGGNSFYLVEVALTGTTPPDMPLLPGMQAEIFIQNGERTLVSYLFKPLTDGFARAMNER